MARSSAASSHLGASVLSPPPGLSQGRGQACSPGAGSHEEGHPCLRRQRQRPWSKLLAARTQHSLFLSVATRRGGPGSEGPCNDSIVLGSFQRGLVIVTVM